MNQHLYHLAEADNLPSILEHGLLSTARLLELTGANAQVRAEVLRGHRADNLRLSPTVVIRDQKPMPPAALLKALDDGFVPADWYALLNELVFLWPDRERLERHRRACGERPQTLLTFDLGALLKSFEERAFVSPINSGNARRKPARRGRDTLVPYRSWRETGWLTGNRRRPPAEFLFRCDVPATAPYLVDITEI